MNLEIYVQQVNSITKTHGQDMSYQSNKWSMGCPDGGSWFGIARGERVWVFLVLQWQGYGKN